MKKKSATPTPNENFTVTTANLTHLSAATAQEALKAALLSLGVSKATSHLTDEEAVRNLYLLAKPTEDGSKRIHRFSLPWNLRFDIKSNKLVRKEVEEGNKPKEVPTGRITKKTAQALAPAVVNSMAGELDKLTALMAAQLQMNVGFESRLTALEAQVKALSAKPTAPAKAEKAAKQPKAIKPTAPAPAKAVKPSKTAKTKADISDLAL
jgi:hypothetical protein